MRRGWTAIILLLLVLTAGAYLGSPYIAARQFKQAALSGDVDRLDAAVDFPAVRESLKSQLTAAMTARMNDDPSLKDNPFAGLGILLMPAIVNRMVDGLVTPEAIGAMVRRGQMERGRRGEPATGEPRVDYDYGYRTLDRFAVTVRGSDAKAIGSPTFVFARQGVLTWRLVRLDIPPSAFGPAAAPTPTN